MVAGVVVVVMAVKVAVVLMVVVVPFGMVLVVLLRRRVVCIERRACSASLPGATLYENSHLSWRIKVVVVCGVRALAYGGDGTHGGDGGWWSRWWWWWLCFTRWLL